MRICTACCIALMAGCMVVALPAAAQQPAPATESVHSALCRIIDNAARDYDVPADFLTNLIWRESSFRRHVVSPAGAQGIAQFMPYTAAERGLADPFDPEQAIPQAARLIADLTARFGNLGLAAAAYNGGPGRVDKWLAGEGGLPGETRTYVLRVTGRAADEWAALARSKAAPASPRETPSCATIAATLRRRVPAAEAPSEPMEEAPFAPWGVQLAGNFSKERALAAFARERQRYVGVIGEAQPMIIGTRLRSRGTRAFYRVRVPAETRAAADQLCNRIRAVGGGCVVLRS
jgi:transglycosylase-like protein with SLT domain/sporulation related protein